MGREREKKGAMQQQQWQAKGPTRHDGMGATGGALALLGKFNKSDECYGSGEGSNSCSASAMRDPLARTKVVMRRLPPTLSEQALVTQIEAKYAGTYSWLAFLSGKSSHKKQVHSRAYIDFNDPENIFSFCEDFHGHVFVNEKGSQYKAVVEYAPYQRVPDLRAKKDGREGSIFKDPDYLEFLETLGKPTELLPSAEVQLERREAERLAAGGSKEGPVVTPLMEFVRQRRAAKASQRSSMSKLGFRSGIMGPPPSFVLQKRGAEKGKSTSTSENGKDTPTYVRREPGRKRRETSEFKEKKPARENIAVAEEVSTNGVLQKETEDNSISDLQATDLDAGVKKDYSKRKLLKEKDKNDALSPGYIQRSRPPVSPAGQQQTSSTSKHLNYRERPVRSALMKELEPGTERRVSKSQALRISPDADSTVSDEKGNGSLDGRRLRNKDRPDRPVWTPRRRLDAVQAQDSEVDTVEGIQNSKGSAVVLPRFRATRVGNAHEAFPSEPENDSDGRNGAFENGTYRLGNRKDRQGLKDGDNVAELGKHIKRGVAPFPSNEKQVWVAVQKSGSGP